MSMVDALERTLVLIKEAQHAVTVGEFAGVRDSTTDALEVLSATFTHGTTAEAEAYRPIEAPAAHATELAKALAQMKHAVEGAIPLQTRISAAHDAGDAAAAGDMDEVRRRTAWTFQTGLAVAESANALA